MLNDLKIDHAREAARLVNVYTWHDALASNAIAEAQVHATLTLAAQQHTANIIAALDKWGGEPGSWPFVIREGLGITTDEVT